MPLSASVLKGLIKTQLAGLFTITDDATLDKFAQAVANAVVTHIQAQALVTGTVTSGAGSGGAVTGVVS